MAKEQLFIYFAKINFNCLPWTRTCIHKLKAATAANGPHLSPIRVSIPLQVPIYFNPKREIVINKIHPGPGELNASVNGVRGSDGEPDVDAQQITQTCAPVSMHSSTSLKAIKSEAIEARRGGSMPEVGCSCFRDRHLNGQSERVHPGLLLGGGGNLKNIII